jgi:hypothetical protein
MYKWAWVDISVEQVAARAAENNLPEPFLHLDTLQPSTSALSSPYPTYRQATLDPWSVPRFGSNGGGSDFAVPRSATTINGGASSLAGSGLPGEWWKMEETVDVTIQGQQGFILNRFTVYEITTEVRAQSSILLNTLTLYGPSTAHLFIVGIRNSHFYGTAWCDDTLSVCYLPFRPNVFSVSLVFCNLWIDSHVD